MAVSVAFAEGQPFSRYQTIIDRKPFGPEPVNFDPEALPGSAAASVAGGEMTPEQRTAEERQLAAKVRVSILNVTPAGVVKVGFTDSSVTPNENYYLKVGASQNGWTVKDADPKTESVTLEKDGVEVTLKLGEASGGRDAKGGQSKRRHIPAAMPLSASNRDAAPAASGRGRSLGGLARLRQQRMEKKAEEQAEAERKREAAAVAEAARKEREAAEAAEKQRMEEERQQQREALRQIQEQLRKAREEREAAAANSANEEEQGETDNAE